MTRRPESGHKKSAHCATVCVTQNTQPRNKPDCRLSFCGDVAPFGRWFRPLRGWWAAHLVRPWSLQRRASPLGPPPGEGIRGQAAGQGLKRSRNGAANRQGIAQDIMLHTSMNQFFIPVRSIRSYWDERNLHTGMKNLVFSQTASGLSQNGIVTRGKAGRASGSARPKDGAAVSCGVKPLHRQTGTRPLPPSFSGRRRSVRRCCAGAALLL